MRTMSRTRLRIGVALTLAALLLAAGAGLLARPGTATPAEALAKETVAAPAPSAPGRSGPQRILLAASAASREFQFLRQLLTRRAEKKQVTVSVHLQTRQWGGPGPGALARFPDLLRPESYSATKEADRPYNLALYDLVIACDVDWARATPEALVLLQSWVEKRGGGLILVAGPAHTPSLGKQAALARGLGPVLELCPVVPADRPRDGGWDRPRRLHFAKGAPDLPFLRLDEGGKGPRAGWDAFYGGGKDKEPEHGFFDCQPVKAVRRGGRVLLTYPDSQKKLAEEVPFLVIAQRGQGRVTWLGSGEMWRLRAYREEYHERFWMELARYAGPGSTERPSP